MKKIFNLVFIALLSLSMISCDRMLKNALEVGAGFGDVIAKASNVTIDEALTVTSGAIDFDKAVVKISGKSSALETSIKDIKTGSQTITIEVPSLDGKMIYSGTSAVSVVANELTTANISLSVQKATTNSYKIILTEATFNSTFKSGDASSITYSDINKVTLAGGMNDWSNSSGAYTLSKQTNGSWVGYFPLTDGVEFKFIVSTTASSNTWTGGSNNVAQETAGIVEKELTWKVILTEAKFNSTFKSGDASSITYSDINKITLAGGMNDWSNSSGAYTLSKQTNGSWVGYFPLTDGVEFKFIVSTTASSNTWTGGSNNVVQETAGVITQTF